MSSTGNPKVLIVMGSPSDTDVMREAKKVLQSLGVSCRMGIYSAHRTPGRQPRSRRARATTGSSRSSPAPAGAHLAGAMAARTILPVIGVPLAASLSGLDALLATVQMPPGFPVGTVAVGKAGAQNAAHFAAQIVALSDPRSPTRSPLAPRQGRRRRSRLRRTRSRRLRGPRALRPGPYRNGLERRFSRHARRPRRARRDLTRRRRLPPRRGASERR